MQYKTTIKYHSVLTGKNGITKCWRRVEQWNSLNADGTINWYNLENSIYGVRDACSQWSRNTAVRCIPRNVFVYTRSHSGNVHNSIVYNNEIFKQLGSTNSRITWNIHIMEKYTVTERNEDLIHFPIWMNLENAK